MAALLLAMAVLGWVVPPPVFETGTLLDPIPESSAARAALWSWTRGEFRPGETFGQLMSTFDLSPAEVARVVESTKAHANLARLRAGTDYAVATNAAGDVRRFTCDLDPERTLVVSFTPDGPASELREHPFDRAPSAIAEAIDGSLFGTLSPDGTRDALPMAIAEIFGWQVDFHHDLHPGDAIEVLYESLRRDGQEQGSGQVLYAALTLGERRYEAWYHEGSDGRGGYYDRDGRSLKQQFLRSPLEYGRMTSGFTTRRFHPVLGVNRPHWGVDYAAPTGTPIRATADGTVTRVSRGRGEGNYVTLRHANGFETSYLHMSRFRPRLRPGDRVGQGETIGFVGSTGFATGPHVDYRMRRAGRWVDPRKAVIPPAPPLRGPALQAFETAQRELGATFERLISTQGGVTAG